MQTSVCQTCWWAVSAANATASAAHHCKANPGHQVHVSRTSVGVFCAGQPIGELFTTLADPPDLVADVEHAGHPEQRGTLRSVI